MGTQHKDDGSHGAGVIKEVYVGPLAARREMLAVCVMIMVVIALMALRFSIIAGSSTKESLRSYQRFDGVLQDQYPILYRSLLSAVGEICDVRDIEGKWPTAQELKDENVPPFEADFLPVGLKNYAWSHHGTESWVDYYGIDESSVEAQKEAGDKAITFVLRVIDLKSGVHPHPHVGVDNDPALKYSVQVWMYEGKRPYSGEEMIKKGWKWIISANDPVLGKKQEISETPAND